MKKVIVITGIGGMGMSIARRIGTGYKLIIADFVEDKLAAAAKTLSENGYDVETQTLDITDGASVEKLAAIAASKGVLRAIVHTAGLSPNMSDASKILSVNLLGTARIISAFEKYITQDAVGIIISSMAAYNELNLDLTTQAKLATLPAEELKNFVDSLMINDPGPAYVLSKKGNHLQVQAAAVRWGTKGARLVSISPGIISTPMGLLEQSKTPQMGEMLQHSPTGRIGTPEDIAQTVEFLMSATFITGSDILVDGGVVALTKNLLVE